ncbi:MAG TPA: metal-dependent hydrolase [Methanocorpusculum sp.]|nr:metal-dependent hydrolase [Methanocorpusculum sp.]
MLIFHHLFIGLMIGAILAVLFSNKWAMIYGGIGGVIPDIIDKPLGQILLADTLNFGRIYAHTLLFAAVLIILGAVIWYKNRKMILLLCIGTAVFVHQLSDIMWTTPINWFWPFFGSFPHFDYIYLPIEDGGLSYLYMASWILAVIAGAVVIFIFSRDLDQSRRGASQIKKILIVIGAILLAKYLIWDMLLTGPWADFFGTMYFEELLSISEWTYGIISLILILLLLDYPLHFSKKMKRLTILACGTGALIMSLLLLIGFGLGFPIDIIYDETFEKVLACAGLFAGGIILLSLEERLLHLI